MTRAAPRRGAAFASVVLAGALVPLNSTMIALGLTPIADAFDVSVGGSTWLVSTYLIAMAVVQPLGGRLGDLVGHRRAFIGGLLGFALFSAAAAAAGDFTLLVVLRVAQAVAGGTMMPNGAALLRAATPADRRGRAFGWFGTGLGLAAAVGPPLGGVLVSSGGWRTIFLANLPIALVALLLALWAIERDPRVERRTSFDAVGAAGTTLVLGAFVAALFLIPRDGVAAAAAGAAALAGGALLVRAEKARAHPFLEVDLFRSRPYAAATATIFLHNLCMYALLLIVPFVVERRLGHGAEVAGAVVAALSVTMMLGSPVGGAFSDRRGRRAPVAAGSAALVAGVAVLLVAGSAPAVGLLAAGLAVVGAGVGVAGASLQAAAVEASPQRLAGAAAGLYMTSRYAGGIAAAGIAASAADADAIRPALVALLCAAALSVVAAAGLGGRLRRSVSPDEAEAASIAGG